MVLTIRRNSLTRSCYLLKLAGWLSGDLGRWIDCLHPRRIAAVQAAILNMPTVL